MIMTYSKHDEYGNGTGGRVELDPMTEAEVAEMRAEMAKGGWKESNRTRNLSDAQFAEMTQRQK
jgi:hypothetical protein